MTAVASAAGTAAPARPDGPTIEALARDAAAAFREAGIDTAGLDARILAGLATGLDRVGLICEARRPADAAAIERMRDLVARRLAGEPVARILGRKEFWGLDFALGPQTLVPRPDSETVVAAALARADAAHGRDAPLRIADLGTGTGCLLIALLRELPAAYGMGLDVDESALSVARANAQALGMAGRAAFVRGSWCDALAGPFDVAVANPPYIPSGEIAALAPEVAGHDPRAALDGGADGLAAYRAILAGGRRMLWPGGALILELGIGQAEAVAGIARAEGLEVAGVETDMAGVARALVALAPLDPAPPEGGSPGSQKALGKPERTG